MIIKPKGISINHDVYQLIKTKQLELNGKSGKYFKIIDIADMAIRNGLVNIGLDKDNRLSIVETNEPFKMMYKKSVDIIKE